MKARRHTPEQVIRKLREADRLLGEGKAIGEVCRHLEVSEATYHRWQRQFGGMKADDVKRLKELERENARLKAIVADQALACQALKEVAKGRMKVKFGRRFLCSWRVGVVGGGSRRRCAGRRPGRARRSGAPARGAGRG